MTSQAHAIIACDFLVVETALLQRLHVLIFIEHGTRRVHLAGMTARPTGAWAAQQARNLAPGLGDRLGTLQFLIHDRDPLFTTAFGEVFKSEGIRIITTLPRTPRMKPRVAYCTSSGRCAVFWCRPGQTVAVGSDILLAVSGVSGVVRRRWVSLRPCARAGGLGPGGG